MVCKSSDNRTYIFSQKSNLPEVKPANTELPTKPYCKLSSPKSALIVIDAAGKIPWSTLQSKFKATIVSKVKFIELENYWFRGTTS